MRGNVEAESLDRSLTCMSHFARKKALLELENLSVWVQCYKVFGNGRKSAYVRKQGSKWYQQRAIKRKVEPNINIKWRAWGAWIAQ